MPEISRFYGIIVKMYYNDHGPPHVHAEYGEHELVVAFAPIAILAGSAPFRVRSMVLEWVGLHQAELLQDWQRCRAGQEPTPIVPLE